LYETGETRECIHHFTSTTKNISYGRQAKQLDPTLAMKKILVHNLHISTIIDFRKTKRRTIFKTIRVHADLPRVLMNSM